MAQPLLLANPKKTRGGKKRRPARNPVGGHARKRRSGRRARRNPIGLSRGGRGGLVGGITRAAMGSALGAAGALALDFGLRFAPVNLKVGPMSHVTKAALAVAVGLLASRRYPMVARAAEGALTVTLYNAARQYVAVPMGLSEISEGDMYELAGAYGDGMGAYMDPPQLGVSSAPLGVGTPSLGAYEMAGAEYQ